MVLCHFFSNQVLSKQAFKIQEMNTKLETEDQILQKPMQKKKKKKKHISILVDLSASFFGTFSMIKFLK